MKPSHYEQLYGKRSWIYLGLLIALVTTGAGLWKPLGRLWAPSVLQAGVPATARENSPEVSLKATIPQPTPQDVPASDRTSEGTAVVPVMMGDLMVRVQRGNCLWRLAERHCGTGFRWPEIYQANRPPIVDPDLIHPGQTFRIPCGK